MDDRNISIKGLFFEITDKCNFNCIYCYNDSSVKKNEFLPVEAYGKFMECIKELDPKEVSISGGEPTLHPNLFEILGINHSLGLHQFLITNGTGISEDLISSPISEKLNFALTIDGYDEITNDLMRGKNTYSITMRAIKLLVSHGLADRIKIRSNLHFTNYKKMYSIAETLNSIGVTNIRFSLLAGFGRATGIEIIDRVRHANIIREIENDLVLIKDNFAMDASFTSKIEFGCPYQELKDIILRVDAHGTIYPCQGINHVRFSLGNIYLTSAASLKNNIIDFSDYVISRQSYMQKCQQCAIRSFCQGGCISLSLEHSGDPLVADRFCSIRKEVIMQDLSKVRAHISKT